MSHIPVAGVPEIEAYKVSLRPIQLQDLECVRAWRNDPDISQWMLNRNHISEEQQQQWFYGVSQDQTQWHFVVWFREQRIGVLNIKSLDGKKLGESKRAEPGLYIGDKRYRGNFVAFCPAMALNDYCFRKLGIRNLEAKVLNTNISALRFNSSMGYEVFDKDNQITTMQLKPERYFEESLKIKKLIR